MRIDELAPAAADALRSASGYVTDLLTPTLRIGVTGLSRAGKTVFITALVRALVSGGRLPFFSAQAQGRVGGGWLEPQPDDAVPRFEYEAHLAALGRDPPEWPQSTRSVSELRVTIAYQPTTWLRRRLGPSRLHVDIVDYPGEWLVDLALLERDFAAWSDEALAQARAPNRAAIAAPFMAFLEGLGDAGPLDEQTAMTGARIFTAYLAAARAADNALATMTPGRFLMPGDLAGSPLLTFFPLPAAGRDKPALASFLALLARRYDSYKTHVVRPFFREHFSRLDRQIVLVDALGALNAGPDAMVELEAALDAVLAAFRPGQGSWLDLLLGRRIDRLLFAATKADHLHHSQHPRLSAITAAMLREARDRADFSGARTDAMSIASLRTTTEETIRQDGEDLPAVRGRLMDGRLAAFYPGELPANPAELLVPAQQGANRWLDGDYAIMNFLPAPNTLRPGDGPPHIRLDRAAEFLIGDRL